MTEDLDSVLLHVNRSVEPPQHIKDKARISPEDYEKLHKQSINNPDEFWGKVAEEELEWFQKWDKVRDWNYPHYKWFTKAKLNITHNCLDRHVNNGKADKVAFHYINEQDDEETITYSELLKKVCKFSNALKDLGVQKGDRVCIYMPLTIEQLAAMLACARIGAIHSVVYAGFSANALRMRMEDAQSKVLITATHTYRRGKELDLKAIADEAVQGLDFVEHVIVHSRKEVKLSGKQKDLDTLLNKATDTCEPEQMDAEDTLFILYTSGTTGKPKGVLHTTAGYNLFTHYTTKIVFDVKEDDVFWCTADAGWITGHSYILYGPLSLGCTSVISEGAPTYPDAGRWWSLVDKYKVSIFYTAPTAIRMFMSLGSKWPEKYDLSSLRILGSVGEPINPEAWNWYHEHIGRKNCAVVDTWWQTETGGHMIVNLPSMVQKPGMAGKPFFGIQAEVVDKNGKEVEPGHVGFLVIREPWPSALRTCWNDEDRYREYWNQMGTNYYPGDFATMDEDGYIMILGRADDVINVSGHRIGSAEVESALVGHHGVAEAAVIGKQHAVKGETIKAFVILYEDTVNTPSLVDEMKQEVRKELGGLAVPEEIQIVTKLPKTRSGKIMRRVLKAQETGEDAGDTSTLED